MTRTLAETYVKLAAARYGSDTEGALEWLAREGAQNAYLAHNVRHAPTVNKARNNMAAIDLAVRTLSHQAARMARKPNTNERRARAFLALAMNGGKAHRDDISLPDGDFPLGIGHGTIERPAYVARLLLRAGTYRYDAAHFRTYGLPEHKELADELATAGRDMLARARAVRLMNR